jgi:hypothetical protein
MQVDPIDNCRVLIRARSVLPERRTGETPAEKCLLLEALMLLPQTRCWDQTTMERTAPVTVDARAPRRRSRCSRPRLPVSAGSPHSPRMPLVA